MRQIINNKDNEIDIRFPLANSIHNEVSKYFDSVISKHWNVTQIKFIESLLFLSMIPIHSDSVKRQIAMLARGISLLNEVTDGFNKSENIPHLGVLLRT